MQPPADHDLELALSDFMQMKRDRALPPQMEIKLGYL